MPKRQSSREQFQCHFSIGQSGVLPSQGPTEKMDQGLKSVLRLRVRAPSPFPHRASSLLFCNISWATVDVHSPWHNVPCATDQPCLFFARIEGRTDRATQSSSHHDVAPQNLCYDATRLTVLSHYIKLKIKAKLMCGARVQSRGNPWG